jgi:hypothetical protein
VVVSALLLVVGGLAAPSLPAGAGETSRTETKSYATDAGSPLDCATGTNGACFSLAGGEVGADLTALDDEGWRNVQLGFSFLDGAGTVLVAGRLCGGGSLPIPKGSTQLQVSVAAISTVECAQPSVSQSGRITVQWDLKRSPHNAPIDTQRACAGGLGEIASYALQPDDGKVRDVRVLVVLDGITEAHARELMTAVVAGYAKVGLNVLPAYQAVTLPATDLTEDGLFAAVKAQVGTTVPTGFDLVHTMTNKDIVGAAGYAYCVGGLRSRANAYSISEVRGSVINIIAGVPSPVWFWGDAYFTAHEIGHLFGGNHDLANCAEGILVTTEDVPGTCTLMYPYLNISYGFSTLNKAQVRGHARDFLGR